jgi:hypothetical protein
LFLLSALDIFSILLRFFNQKVCTFLLPPTLSTLTIPGRKIEIRGQSIKLLVHMIIWTCTFEMLWSVTSLNTAANASGSAGLLHATLSNQTEREEAIINSTARAVMNGTREQRTAYCLHSAFPTLIVKLATIIRCNI